MKFASESFIFDFFYCKHTEGPSFSVDCNRKDNHFIFIFCTESDFVQCDYFPLTNNYVIL
jgi:hypothetical protein